MGGFESDVDSHSTLSPWQESVEKYAGISLSDLLSGAKDPWMNKLKGQILGKDPASKAANQVLMQLLKNPFKGTEKQFNQGVLDPMLRSFDREIAPRINTAYAGQGAAFSTRRGDALTNALGDMNSDAMTKLFEAFESAKNRQFGAIGMPLQQTLGRVQGLSGLNQYLYGPALQYLGTQTRDLSASPGIGSQALGLAGTIGGAMMGGGFGGGGGKGGGSTALSNY